MHPAAGGDSPRKEDVPETNRKSEEFFRLSIVWMIGIMAFYAWIGEKVPWLIIPQLLPMCFVATYRLNWQKTVFALAGCLFLLVMTWHVAFIPADINEPIVQVQNSEDLREVMGLMDNSSLVVIGAREYWPLPWYYRGSAWNRIRLYRNIRDFDTMVQMKPDLIIFEAGRYPSIGGYTKRTIRMSYWSMLPEEADRRLAYYLTREGNVGSTGIDVFLRQDIPP